MRLFQPLLPTPTQLCAPRPIPSTAARRSCAETSGHRGERRAGHGRSPRLRPAAMHFLKTLFWVVIAVFLAILASRNWHDVTLNLWGDIQADIKVPVLIGAMFLLGWLPTYLIYRAKLWRQRQRRENIERQQVAPRTEPSVEDVPAA